MSARKKTIQETPTQTTFAALHRCASKIASEVYKSLPTDLTVSQFGIFEALHKRGTLHQCDPAKYIQKTTGNITTVVDNLEKRGLVERVKRKDNRRYFQTRVTQESSKLTRKLYPK